MTVNLKMFINGYYTGSGTMDVNGDGGVVYMLDQNALPQPVTNPSFNDMDLVTITAVDPNTLIPAESQTGILHIDGTMSVSFTSAVTSGQPYYLKITHQNSVETWSKTPQNLVSGFTYDFTSNSTQAYDDGFTVPMKLVDQGVWAIYNGDINQDGTVDGQDMTLEEIDSNTGAFGYNASDLNGDGASDGQDMTIIEIISNIGVFTAHP